MRLGPIALVLGERHLLGPGLAALLVGHQLEALHRRDLGVEAPGLLPGRGALLAHQRELVLRLARHLVALRHRVGGLDHRHVHFGLVLDQPLIGEAMLVHVVLDEADRFEAAADGDVDAIDHDALGGDADRHEARAAEAVDGLARHGDRQAGADRRVARDVVPGGALGIGAAEDDVLDLGRARPWRARPPPG